MPYVPIGYAQANHVLRLTGDNEDMIVTLGIKFDTIVFEDLETIANALFGHFNDAWDGLLCNSYSLSRVVLYANFGGENLVVQSTSTPIAFDSTAQVLPQNCALLVKKASGLGGRANRGRCYIPGLPDTAVGATGNVDATQLGLMQTAANSWLTAVNGTTGVDFAVILHVANIPEPTEISQLVVDPYIATQRRRLR